MLLRGQFQGLFRGRLQDLRVGSSGSVELSRVESSRVESSREARPVKIRGAGSWPGLGLGLESWLWRLVKECRE